jgi:hypothetical protein
VVKIIQVICQPHLNNISPYHPDLQPEKPMLTLTCQKYPEQHNNLLSVTLKVGWRARFVSGWGIGGSGNG